MAGTYRSQYVDDNGDLIVADLVDDMGSGVNFSGLNPLLGSLGELVDLLQAGTADGEYSLNNEWFLDPINKIKDGVTADPKKFEAVLAGLLGKIGGNAQGIPVQNEALLGTWYPISYQGKATGFYVVSYIRTIDNQEETVLGLGILHQWEVPASPKIAVLKVNVWGLIPFVRIGNGQFNITFTSPGYPIVAGVSAEGAKTGEPLVDINGISFNGVKFSVSIDFAAEKKFEAAIEVLALKLAGDEKPSNRSLADLAALTGKQMLETAASLFVGALSRAFPTQEKRIRYLMPLLGLSSQVPGQSEKLPVLEWYQLLYIALHPSEYPNGIATPFINWFNAISSDTDQLKSWLKCLGGFLKNDAGDITGTGTRNNPLKVMLLAVGSIGSLDFNVGTLVTEDGTRHFYPGLSFNGAPFVFGGSDVALLLEADLELADFKLSGDLVDFSPTVEFQFRMSLQNSDAKKPLVSFKEYSFGALRGGLCLGLGGKIIPYFTLDQVIIPPPTGVPPYSPDQLVKFEIINLLSPVELAETGAAVLNAAIKSLLGVGDGGEQGVATHIAALIGLIPPPLPKGVVWPDNLLPPFSAKGIVGSILRPISAWSDYYYDSLQEEVDGRRAFVYLLEQIAQLIQKATDIVAIEITGEGTASKPWKAGISIKDQALPAYLTAYSPEKFVRDEPMQLIMALELAPVIRIASVDIVPSLRLSLVSLLFPGKGKEGPVTATWLPNLSLAVSLPEKLQSPPLGGISVGTLSSQLSATWSQSEGWGWSLFVEQPFLEVYGSRISLGKDLDFSHQTALKDLVESNFEAFRRFIVPVLGAALLKTGTRAGLFATGALGLLTDLSKSKIFPQGLKWEHFTSLSLSSFTDLSAFLRDIRKLLAENFDAPDKSKSVLSLLSWTLAGGPTAPPIPGKGVPEDPWMAPMPLGFSLPVWYNTISKILGAGIGRADTFNFESGAHKFSYIQHSLISLVEYGLADGAFGGFDPRFQFLGTLSNPDGKLVDLGLLGHVGQIMLGFTVSLQKGQVVFEPVVKLLNAKLITGHEAEAIDLVAFLNQDFSASLQSSFLDLLNRGLQFAFDFLKKGNVEADYPLFHSAYELLCLLGLCVVRKKPEDPYGINTAGWQALLADPQNFIVTRLHGLLIIPGDRKQLCSFLENVLHIKIPVIPEPVLQLLYGLDICGQPEAGYPLEPKAVLELLSSPVKGLEERFKALINDPEKLKRIAVHLTKDIPVMTFGRFRFSTYSNGLVRLEVPREDAFQIGSFLEFYGALVFDINNLKLSLETNLYCAPIGLCLQTIMGIHYQEGRFEPSLISQIIWGDGSKPAAIPLQLWPFDHPQFLGQLAELAPAYALNIVLNFIFDGELLEKYPLIQQLFKGLGLAKKADIANARPGQVLDTGSLDWQMGSLMGILKDPLGWLLSDSVLGQNGRFSLSKLVVLLSNLPEASYQGIGLKPLAGTGVRISGLPYGFEIDIKGTLDGDHGLSTFTFGTKEINIANGTALLNDLSLAISLDTNYQPGFSGSVKLSTDLASGIAAFFVTIDYDLEFGLRITKGKPSDPVSPPQICLQLLPFLGWGRLAAQAAQAAAQILIEQMPKLLEAIGEKSKAAKEFVERMQQLGTQLDVLALTSKLIAIVSSGDPQDLILEKLQKAGLDWLKERFSQSHAPATVNALIALFPEGLRDKFSQRGGMLAFAPSANLPITLLAGQKGDLLGLWVDLQLPGTELLKIAIQETGVGVNFDDGKVAFDFGVFLKVPIDGDTGPALLLQYINEAEGGFRLSIDPLGKEQNLPSALSRQLLPVFFPGPGDLGTKMVDWLLLLIKDVLPRYLSVLVLNIPSVSRWLGSPIVGDQTDTPTPALLLEAAMIIVDTGSSEEPFYALNSLDKLASITPKSFFGNLLITLMKKKLTLLKFGDSGSISIGPKIDAPDYYGVVLAAPDLKFDKLPGLTLQLGARDTDWIKNSSEGPNWLAKNSQGVTGEPGLGFFVPITTQGSEVSADFLKFNVVLYNVGFDYSGKDNQPLVNLERFKIGAVKPRMLFELAFGSTPLITFGAGITLQDIAVSVAPNKLVAGKGDNPIASNILGAGDQEGSDKNPPTNPTFSLSVAYCTDLWVNLQSNTGNGEEVIVPVQRGFGPLFIESLGLGWKKSPDNLLDFIFSGDLALAGLKLSLMGLRVGIPVTEPADITKYKIDLDGIDINFKGGSVSLEAGLLRINKPLSYTGQAVIKAASFSLSAIGSYAELPNGEDPPKNTPSLFVFGVLNMPLGGPPAFFITGIAAGFAYNRGLLIPDITEVSAFPLVRGLMDGSFQGNNPDEALVVINEIIYPDLGQYWLAAGIKFTSFQLLETAALLFVGFGKDFEINLLGLTYAVLPPKAPLSWALAYMELAIKISFRPSAGVISAEAQLTPNSFVLSKDCRITGGFAFYLWYKSNGVISAGDFVITLGGYHPAFDVPEHYPEVPRLGMIWKMDVSVGSLAISGGVYFALCPTAIMTGGFLSVAFEVGPLKAWLNAYANFLIEWNPVYFNVGIGICVGVSFGFTLGGVTIRLTVELGASMELQGPPVHGYVEVKWYVISFTIPIGSGQDETTGKNISWGAFAKSFLPPADPGTGDTNPLGKAADPGASEDRQPLKWNTGEGLISLDEVSATWFIQPVPFSISIDSAIPVSAITCTGDSLSIKGKVVGVRPMGFTKDLESPLTLTLFDASGAPVKALSSKIRMEPALNGAPAALWSKEKLDRNNAPNSDPESENPMLLPDRLFGLVLIGDTYRYYGKVPAFLIDILKYTPAKPVQLPFAQVPAYKAAQRYPDSDQEKAYRVIKASIMKSDTVTKRNAVLASLAANHIKAPASPDLTVMSASADLVLQALPVIARLAIYQNGGIPVSQPLQPLSRPPVAQRKGSTVKSPTLTGILRRYASTPKARLGPSKAGPVSSQWSSLTGSSQASRLLYNGGLHLWQLDKRSNHKLRMMGDLPVAISCFDSYGELLDHRRFAGQPTTFGKPLANRWALPGGTAQLVLQGAGYTTGIRGCLQHDLLCKVNDNWFAGDSVLIRAQNSQRIPIASSSSDGQQGLMEMKELMDRNLCTDGENTTFQGWIQAVFPGDCSHIAVVLDNAEASTEDLALTLQRGALPDALGRHRPLARQILEQGVAFIFEVPSSPGNQWIGLLMKTSHLAMQFTGLVGMQALSQWVDRSVLEPEKAAPHLSATDFLTTKSKIIVN